MQAEKIGDEDGRGRGILSIPGNCWAAPDVIRIHEIFEPRTPASTLQTIHSTSCTIFVHVLAPAFLCLLEISRFPQIFPEAAWGLQEKAYILPMWKTAPARKAGYYHGALEKPIGGSQLKVQLKAINLYYKPIPQLPLSHGWFHPLCQVLLSAEKSKGRH